MMEIQFSNNIMSWADISLQDGIIPGTSWEEVSSPCHWSHSFIMSMKSSDLSLLVDIPNQNLSWIAPYTKERVNRRPGYRGDGVTEDLTKLGNFKSGTIPQIDGVPQPNS